MRELLRATWVIARRDFTALSFSKAFVLFLIVPLLFAGIGIGAGMVGRHAANPEGEAPAVALHLPAADAQRLIAKRDELQQRFDLGDLPMLATGGHARGDATLSGSIDHPVLTGSREHVDRLQGRVALILDAARQRDSAERPPLVVHVTASAPDRPDAAGRAATAQMGQAALFMITLLLGGMVLSNLVEEKTGKIIEILAASIPLDAIFLGKLLAMLGIAVVAMIVWGVAAEAVQAVLGIPLPELSAPAVGWPWFALLAVAYFASAYMLLGALLLGIGSLAGTVREVQTLSMPVTMGQLLIFFLASYAVNSIGQPIEIVAAVFPFSSPFAMLSRAAQQPALLPHLAALVWQVVWVAVTVRVGSALFRRNVFKSGGSGKARGAAAGDTRS